MPVISAGRNVPRNSTFSVYYKGNITEMSYEAILDWYYSSDFDSIPDLEMPIVIIKTEIEGIVIQAAIVEIVIAGLD